jgi:pimeloyl-ACP methyl ester carboxylesterase
MTNLRRAGAHCRFAVALVLVSAGLVVVLTGCTSDSGEVSEAQALDDGASTIQQLEVPQASVPSKYYDQRVLWRPCGIDECGAIQVPRDWSDLPGGSISIALIEHKAEGTPIGTLVVDPGGPGGSGITWVGEDYHAVVDAAVAAKYNIVGFDPRGVGQSTAVSCLSAKQLDRYIFAPAVGAIGSSIWITDQRHRATVMAEGCDHGSGVLLDNVDTVSVAHDLDVIRSALGQSKLDYLGDSWGTYLGTVYAGLYPTNTGRMVLDGAVDPWSEANLGGMAQAVGFEGDLDAYLSACLAGKSEAVGGANCPFSGTRAAAERSVSAMLSSADRHPLTGPGGLQLDGEVLSDAIVEALYSPSYWPRLTTIFDQLQHGVTTEAMVFIDARFGLDVNGVPVNNFEVAFTAIRCLENGSFSSLTRDRTQLLQLKKVAPVLGVYDAYSDLICSAWDYGPAPFPVPIHASNAAQLLVVGTTGDPATPYKEAQDLARQLTTSHLVTYHGEGHTAYDKGNACIDRTIDKYLLHGTVPASDPECH